MSLSVDGTWKGGVWGSTVWAASVWFEGYQPKPPPMPGWFALIKDSYIYLVTINDNQTY